MCALHTPHIPLAERMRPTRLEDFVGQEHLVGPGKLLRRMLAQGAMSSLLFWGPPGVGKTTLAAILAQKSKANFVFFSAVLSGVKEIRQIVEQANHLRQQSNVRTILFVDEIHRFNKGQQDAFLPHMESGLLTLIGATTENPSFEINAPLLSRCQVLLLLPLGEAEIRQVVERALHAEQGLGAARLIMDEQTLLLLAQAADGDCRRALNFLESAATLALDALGPASPDQQPRLLRIEWLREALQQRSLRYDARGEEHYNLISALHKSLRDSDPDGAVYWLGRMLASGEDPLYLARRMIRFASEDVGNAEPQALQVALNCRQAYHLLGSPEGDLALYQAAIYLATAPKSNAVYACANKVRVEIERSGSLPVPLRLRNAVSGLMRQFGYGKGYQYAHDDKDALVLQEHLPEALIGQSYYQPSNRGYESLIGERLQKWKQILKERARSYDAAKQKK